MILSVIVGMILIALGFAGITYNSFYNLHNIVKYLLYIISFILLFIGSYIWLTSYIG
jgi:hypothetical protein